MTNNKETQVYNAKPLENIRQTIENAIIMARAYGANVIVQVNGVRFGVGPDTKIQEALDNHQEVLNKMHATEQQLKQNKR